MEWTEISGSKFYGIENLCCEQLSLLMQRKGGGNLILLRTKAFT